VLFSCFVFLFAFLGGRGVLPPVRGRAYFYLIHCAVLVGRGCAKLGGRWSHNLFANLINGHRSVLMTGLRELVRKNRHTSYMQTIQEATFTETVLFAEGLCNA